jgi:hypothetical protein
VSKQVWELVDFGLWTGVLCAWFLVLCTLSLGTLATGLFKGESQNIEQNTKCKVPRTKHKNTTLKNPNPARFWHRVARKSHQKLLE